MPPLGYQAGPVPEGKYHPVLVDYDGFVIKQGQSLKAACRDLHNSAATASTTIREFGRMHVALVNHKSGYVRPYFGWLTFEEHLTAFSDWTMPTHGQARRF